MKQIKQNYLEGLSAVQTRMAMILNRENGLENALKFIEKCKGGVMKKKGDIADPLDDDTKPKIDPETGCEIILSFPGTSEAYRFTPQEDTEDPEPETERPENETTGGQTETERGQDETDALPRIETHTETQSLKCILTWKEVQQAGERMARAVGEKKDNEDTLKSVASRYKSLIDESIAVMGSEAEKIRSGYEFRKVEVRVEFDHSRGTVGKFRTDTFEMIETRRMTDYEAQRKIKF